MAVKRTATKATTKEDEVYYVGISDPNTLRRAILESSKMAIQLLKSYEVIKNLRIEKVELISEFDKEMIALNRLIARMKSALPKTKFKDMVIKKPVQQEPARKVLSKKDAIAHIHGEPVTPSLSHPELDRLESELGDIESKMLSLR